MDDTLIFCGRYYEQVIQRFLGFVADLGQQNGITSDRAELRQQFNQIDLANLTRRDLTIKHRFPTSMYDMLRVWGKEHCIAITPELKKEALAIGYSVYDLTFEAMPGACQMLEDLSKTHDLYLYTCGDQDVQIKRILAVSFDHYFKGIGVPERKTPRPLTRFMLANQLKVKSTWVVGNSRKSDILPALEVGVPPSQCILVSSYEWGADVAEIAEPIHVITDLSQVATVIYGQTRTPESKVEATA